MEIGIGSAIGGFGVGVGGGGNNQEVHKGEPFVKS